MSCTKCGRPISECSDPERTYYPQRSVCYADMATAYVRWKYHSLHDETSLEQFHDGSFKNWHKTRSDDFPYAYDDGVSFWVSVEDLTPDDMFLGHPQAITENEEVV